MTDIVATGWDGTNPLHLLAACGTLVLAHQEDPHATLSWRWTGRWTPVIGHRIAAWSSLEDAAVAVAQRVQSLGATGAVDPAANRRVADLKAERKKIEAKRKEDLGKLKADKHASAADRRTAMDACAAAYDRQLVTQDQLLNVAQDVLNDALGAGIAHLGPVIGVPPALFRRKAEAACHDWLREPLGTAGSTPHGLLVAALASHACDAVIDENGLVSPTPLSFANGGGNQWLLQAFRNCANEITASQVKSVWDGSPIRKEMKAVSVGWDPREQKDYALNWCDPAKGGEHDVATNALAFVGLSLMTAMPVNAAITSIGWLRNNLDGLSWPIWDTPLSINAIQSLLGADLKSSGIRNRPGVVAIMYSARINPTGKRNFFAPARPI